MDAVSKAINNVLTKLNNMKKVEVGGDINYKEKIFDLIRSYLHLFYRTNENNYVYSRKNGKGTIHVSMENDVILDVMIATQEHCVNELQSINILPDRVGIYNKFNYVLMQNEFKNEMEG